MTNSATSTSPIPSAVTATGGLPHNGGLQRAGGVAALVEAGTYVVGLGLLAAHLGPRGYLAAEGDPAADLAFLLDNQAALYLWNVAIYLVAGVALVVVVLALHDRLRRNDPGTAQVATALGLIWAGLVLASGMIALVGQRAVHDLAATDPAAAASAWSAVGIVADGVGGGIELVGALWVLLVGAVALRSGALGRRLAVLGIVVGVCGACTVVPRLEAAGAVFGVGLIVWFVWAGLGLLRG